MKNEIDKTHCYGCGHEFTEEELKNISRDRRGHGFCDGTCYGEFRREMYGDSEG